MNNNEILTDKQGKISSKRIAGVSVLIAAGIMAGVLFTYSVIQPIGDPDTAISLINSLLMTGGGLLGVGVFEKIGAGKE